MSASDTRRPFGTGQAWLSLADGEAMERSRAAAGLDRAAYIAQTIRWRLRHEGWLPAPAFPAALNGGHDGVQR